MECDRTMARRAVSHFSRTCRRRSERTLCRLQMRGPLLLEPRYGDGVASANPTDTRFPRRTAAGQIRLSAKAARTDQTRLQESKAHRGDLRDQHEPRWLLGRPGVQ